MQYSVMVIIVLVFSLSFFSGLDTQHTHTQNKSDTELYIKPVFYIYTVKGDIHTCTNATVHLFTTETRFLEAFK